MTGYLVVAGLSAVAGAVACYYAAKKFPRAFGFVVDTVNTVSDKAREALEQK